MPDITKTQELTWTPGAGQEITLRTGGSKDERRRLAIDELTLTLPADAAGTATVQLRFRVDRDTFEQMASRRWFNIPAQFTQSAGIAFGADRPIEMIVATAPMARGGYPLNALLMTAGDGEAKLAMVLEPFLDPDLERPFNNPLMYEVVKVRQPGAGGEGPGFDRAAIEAWERGS